MSLLLLSLGQVGQVWHHANLAAHQTGELCQVCLHAAGSAAAIVATPVLTELIWMCVGSLVSGLSVVLCQPSFSNRQARAPPYYS